MHINSLSTLNYNFSVEPISEEKNGINVLSKVKLIEKKWEQIKEQKVLQIHPTLDNTLIWKKVDMATNITFFNIQKKSPLPWWGGNDVEIHENNLLLH